MTNFVFHHWSRAERARDPEAARRAVVEAFVRWRALGLPFGHDAQGERCYDPAEVNLCMRLGGYQGRDPYWRERHVPSLRSRILSLHPPDTPTDRAPRAAELPGRRMTVMMRRRFNPEYLAKQGRLRIPVPQIDASTRHLDVELDPVTGDRGSVRRTPDYIELRLAGTPTEPITMGARFSFDAYPSVPDATVTLPSAERERCLRPSEDLVQVTPGMVALAQSLARGAPTPIEQVYRFYRHVTKRLDLGPFPHEILNLTPPDHYPAQMGWFDCRRVSAFLVSLCRANEMPARRATGYVLYPAGMAYHHWVEVWIDGIGWYPLDQLSAEPAAAGLDPLWRDALVGAVDYRMNMGYMPRAFNGSPGVQLPAAWTSLECDAAGASQTDIIDLSNNAIVWTDTLRVELGEILAA